MDGAKGSIGYLQHAILITTATCYVDPPTCHPWKMLEVDACGTVAEQPEGALPRVNTR